MKYVNEKGLNNQWEEIKKENLNDRAEIIKLKKARQEVISSSRKKEQQTDLNSMISDYNQDTSNNKTLNSISKKT